MIGLIIVYWLDIAEVGKMQNMQYAGYLSHYVYPRYGSRRVSGLVEQDLQDIILGAFSRPVNRDRKPLSHKTLTKIRACLVSFIKYARKSGVSTLLPEGLYIPKSAPKGQKFPLLKSDLKVLFSDPATIYRGKKSTDWYIHAYRFSVIVGLRPGELAHIQYKRDIKGGAAACAGLSAYTGILPPGKTKTRSAASSCQILPCRR